MKNLLIATMAFLALYEWQSRPRFLPVEGSGIWVQWRAKDPYHEISRGLLMFDTKTGHLCRAWDWASASIPDAGAARMSDSWITCDQALLGWEQ
jgi:hypothetical protein